MKMVRTTLSTVLQLSSDNLINDYMSRVIETASKISSKEIEETVWVLYEAWRSGSRVYTFGNGGSATTASHLANDLSKLTIVDGKPRLSALDLTSNIALMTALSNDNSYKEIFAEQLLNHIKPGDVLIGISTSGNSENVLRAFEVGRQQRATCIGLTGNEGGQLKDLVDYCLYVPDEVIYRQEDLHMIISHILAVALRWLIVNETY